MELNINFDGPEYDKKSKSTKLKAVEDDIVPAYRKQKTASAFNRGEPPGGSSSLPDDDEDENNQVEAHQTISEPDDFDSN